ncbi:MAG: hypothetical protein C0467_20045 [Planctomycetaceae bacterium]|nr:hypothetical protein [Planctomycetaceae bacterium]
MGNPAMVKRKHSEKRRKKYEQRLGPGVYLPKDERLVFNAEAEKAIAAAVAEKTKYDAAKKVAKAKKKAAGPAPAAPEAAKK